MANSTKTFFGKLIEKTKKKVKEEPIEARPMTIGEPMNVKHEWHVGFDSMTGEFQGLPPAWSAWLMNSNIR